MARRPSPSDDPRRQRTETVNERLRSAILAHAVFLNRFAAGFARRLRDAVEGIMAEDAQDVLRMLERARRMPPDRAREYLGGIQTAIAAGTAGGVQIMSRNIRREMRGLVVVEREYVGRVLGRELEPRGIAVRLGSRAEIARRALASSVRGIPMDEFSQRWAVAHAQGLADLTRRAFVNGDDIPTIRAATQTLMQNRAREAEAFARTATNHVASQVRDAVYQANASVVWGYQWLSTLDLRTTPICVSLDGQTWETGKGPLPPAHFNCRSTTVPLLRSAEDAGIAERVTGSTRASMNGQVPDGVTAEEWIMSRSAADQDIIFGPTRGRLLRQGRVTADDLIRPDRTMYTLAELREQGIRITAGG